MAYKLVFEHAVSAKLPNQPRVEQGTSAVFGHSQRGKHRQEMYDLNSRPCVRQVHFEPIQMGQNQCIHAQAVRHASDSCGHRVAVHCWELDC